MATGSSRSCAIRARATVLTDLGVEIRTGDLSRTAAIADAMRGVDAAIHLAGDYRIGIAAKDRPAMLEANVGTTHRVLDAAASAGLDRLVATLDGQRLRRHAWPDRRRDAIGAISPRVS